MLTAKDVSQPPRWPPWLSQVGCPEGIMTSLRMRPAAGKTVGSFTDQDEAKRDHRWWD